MKKLNKIRLILVFALCAFFIGFAQVYAKDPTTKYGRFLNSGDGQNHGINFDIRLTIAGVSGFNTHKFHVTELEMENLNLNGKPAFCADHSKKNEVAADYETAELYYPGVAGYDEVMARILYYGAGGPGDVTGGGADDEKSYFATTWVVNRFYGNTPKTQSSYDFIYGNLPPAKRLLDAVNEERAVPDDFAYVVFTPDDDELQTIVMVAGSVPKNGNLEIVKKDNHGKVKDNATFHITGPGGTWDRTTNGGKIVLNDIAIGTYTITETQAPENMNNEPVNRTVNVEVKPSETITYTRVNNYQRGSASLTKYDSINRGDTQGDATLAGAEFELRAANEIKEGETTIYAANDLVARVVTDENGETPKVEDLPIGNYYYVETKASEGFYINTTRIPVSITYDGQYVPVSAEKHNEVPEEPEYNSLTIIKKMSATSNTPEKYLEGCEFTATLKSDPSYKIRSVYAGNGEYKIQNLPYGLYTIEETIVNPYTLKMENFDIDIKEGDKKRGPYKPVEGIRVAGDTSLNAAGEIVDTTKGMYIKIRKQDYDRTEDQRVDVTQGDAQLKGAIYEITMWNEEDQAYTTPVYDITVDHQDEQGYWVAESEKLIIGKYMVKEKYKSSETIDGVTYYHSYAEGYLIDPEPHYFEARPDEQVEELSYHTSVSKERVQRGAVYVVKYDNDRNNDDNLNDSDKVPSAGAILRLTLDSNPEIYYTVKLDANGEGEFIETNDETHTSTAPHDSSAYYPYTIPYGEYTITEDKEADGGENTSFYIKPEKVSVPKQAKKQYRIEADEPVPVWLRIVKKDKTTGETVPLAGAEFKIWDIKNSKWLVMNDMYNDISTFVTNSEGYLFTPKQLYPGDYIVYESKAPEGYYYQDEWRIPDDSNDLGDKTKGGKFISLDKIVARLPEDAEYPGSVEVGELIYEVNMPDNPLYVNIQLIKTAEKITGVHTENVSYTESNGNVVNLEKHVADYTNVGLEGVSYKIYADEDIYTPDGVLRTTNGTLVDDITTNSDGIAQSRMDLFPGKYRVVEYAVPEGYILDTTPRHITVENKDQYVESATGTLKLNDDRQKLKYTFKKLFEQFKYTNGQADKHAVFGIYTKEPIKAYNGEIVIDANKLVDLREANNDTLITTVELPKGKYYVKELYVTYPYMLNNEQVDFELNYKPDGITKEVELKGTDVVNTVEYGYARAIKVSTSTDNGLITLNKKTITSDEFKNRLDEMTTSISSMNREETENYLKAKKIKTVSDAEYELWLDEEGKSKLMEVNPLTGEQTVAKFTSDNIGILELYELPKGEYFLKEVNAPQKYEIAKRAVPLAITASNPEAAVYEVVIETPVNGVGVHKTDIFTGEDVPNCKFEVRDSENNLLMYAVTDEDGYAHIPEDLFEEGKTYTYTELEAPDVYKKDGRLYKLNTEPHEFVAHFDKDGHLINSLVEVENYRPETKVKFIKTDEEGNLVPNCKFELKSEEPGLYEPKTGVTDKNGIYVFEDVPQGWYIYTELEAPEEYNIDTTPHRVYVTGDEMIIDFVNTGDIPVVAIACLAIACVAGISFITVRKVKATK